MSYWVELKKLRMAQAASGGSRRTLSSGDLKLARHMAQEGATLDQITAALNWNITRMAACHHLAKFNIRSRNGKPSHNGRETTIPQTENGIDLRHYRAGAGR